ncbi:hypothetical protein Scep_030345 [Stephania cephalantha]|uniref:Uncharacterized protein n=1 Tax=Stephania cephalantha TaxID=152367 RepID=A0AAP0E732_9MAGN
MGKGDTLVEEVWGFERSTAMERTMIEDVRDMGIDEKVLNSRLRNEKSLRLLSRGYCPCGPSSSSLDTSGEENLCGEWKILAMRMGTRNLNGGGGRNGEKVPYPCVYGDKEKSNIRADPHGYPCEDLQERIVNCEEILVIEGGDEGLGGSTTSYVSRCESHIMGIEALHLVLTSELLSAGLLYGMVSVWSCLRMLGTKQ